MSPSKRKHTEMYTTSSTSDNNRSNIQKKSKLNTLLETSRQEQQLQQDQQQEQQQPQSQQQQQQQDEVRNKEASILNQQALLKFTLGEFDEAESLLKEALILSHALSTFSQSKHEETLLKRSSSSSSSSDSCNNISISTTVPITKRNCNGNSKNAMTTMKKLKHSQQEYDEGMNLFSTPIEIANIWDGTLKSAALQYNIGQTYIKRRNFVEGIEWFRSAMRTCTEIYQPSWHNDNVAVVFKIIDAVAYCYYRKELYDDAIKFYEVAEHYASNGKLGNKHVAYVKNSLAVVLFRKEAALLSAATATANATATDTASEAATTTSAATTTTTATATDLSMYLNQQQTSAVLTSTKRKAISLLNESLVLYKTTTEPTTCCNEHELSGPSSIYNRTATVYNNLGRVYYLTGDYQQALSYFESALALRRNLFDANSIDLAVTICNLGQTHHHLEQLDEAMTYFNEFLAIAHGALIDESNETESSCEQQNDTFVTHRDLSIVVASVASIHLGRNQLDDAKKMYEMALNSSRVAFGTIHTEVAHILNKLGSVCYKIRQFDLALTYLKEGLEIEQVIYGVHHPNVVVTLMNLAQIYRDQNMYENALMHYGQAHAAIAATKGRDSITASDTLLSMGLMLYRMKAFASSFDFYQEALFVQRKHYGEDTDHAAIASTLNSIAIVLFHLRQARLAITYFEESLKMRRTLFGPNHPDIAVNLFNLAKLHLELHDNETASELYKETLKVERAIQGPLSKEVLQTLQLLGLLHQHNGELTVALQYFSEALDLERERCKGGKSLFAAKLLNLIGNIHLQRGNAKAMMQCFVDATYICEGNIDSVAVAGFNFYSLSKLHPECAETA